MLKNKITVLGIMAIFLLVSSLNGLNTISADVSTSTDFCTDVGENMENYNIILNKTVRIDGTQPWIDSVDIYLGKTVDFRLKLTNDGDEGTYDIDTMFVQDFLPSNLEYIKDSASIEPTKFSEHYVEWKLNECLSVGESLEIIFSAEAIYEECSENYASVICCKEHDWPKDNDTAEVNVEPCGPAVAIEKKIWNGCYWDESAEVHLGDTVRFKAVIYNPSDCYLMHFSGVVFDQLPDNLRYINESSTIFPEWHPGHPDNAGETSKIFEDYDWENNTVYWHKPPTIMPNENLTFYYNATAVGCGFGENNLTAHPEGFDPVDYPGESISNADGSYDESDSASVSVNCNDPSISIDKSVDCEVVCIGEDVEYTYEVTNTGDCSLTNVVVTDDKLPDVEYQSGDDNLDGWLDVDETWIYKATTQLCENTTNTATVTGEDEFGVEVSAEDSVFVEVIDCSCTPSISVDKMIYGDCEWVDHLYVESYPVDVRFKIIVENNGTCDLTDLVIEDVIECGIEDVRDFSITPDEINGDHIYWYYDSLFTPGEQIIIYFNATVHVDSENNVYVDADSADDNTHVSDYDSTEILEYGSEWDRSSIQVTGECVSPDAVFTITNTGESGEGDMDGTSEYRIYRNNVLEETHSFQLEGGESVVVSVPANNCDTIRLEADQRPGHPGSSQPRETIENCGCAQDEPEIEVEVESGFNIGKLNAFVKNNKNIELSSIEWDINVKNRALFKKIDLTFNGIIDRLEPKTEKTVNTGAVKCFGLIDIELKAQAQNLDPVTTNAFGFVMGNIILVIPSS